MTAYNTFQLQGPGSRNQALFLLPANPVGTDFTVQVIAERGLTNCWDDTVSVAVARERYAQLRAAGWKLVPTTITAHELRLRIRD